MLNLQRAKCVISDVNPRAEKHGPEHELACDINLQMIGANDFLAFLNDDLKQALYCLDGTAQQPELLDEPGHLPNLRFPEMSAFNWDYKGEGYTTTLHLGIDDNSDLTLYDCVLNKIKVTPKEGGSVQIDFKVAFYPEQGEIEKLCMRIQDVIDVTLTPPSADGEGPTESYEFEPDEESSPEVHELPEPFFEGNTAA